MIGWTFGAIFALLFAWAFQRYHAERLRAAALERQCARWANLARGWEARSRDTTRRLRGELAAFTAADGAGHGS